MYAAPEMMHAAANDLASLGSMINDAHAAAQPPTMHLIPAAADEVSAAVSAVFANHAQAFAGLAAQASAFHDQFVTSLKSGAVAYAATEAHSAATLWQLPLPTWLKNDLSTAGLYISGFLVGALVIGYFVLGWLISLIAYPFKQLLGALGL
jgi:PE family